jgi:hypothetical protein
MPMSRWMMICALTLMTAGAAHGNEPGFQLVGEARLKVLFWPVYDSRLFTADGSYYDGKRPVRLEIEYLRDISSKNLIERTADEWQAQGLNHQRQNQWLAQLTTLWPDVSRNDVITVELDALDHSTFYRNGEILGSVADPAFSQQFIAIWLSPNTSRPALRRALIGQQ